MANDRKMIPGLDGDTPTAFVRCEGSYDFELGHVGDKRSAVAFLRDNGAPDDLIERAKRLWLRV